MSWVVIGLLLIILLPVIKLSEWYDRVRARKRRVDEAQRRAEEAQRRADELAKQRADEEKRRANEAKELAKRRAEEADEMAKRLSDEETRRADEEMRRADEIRAEFNMIVEQTTAIIERNKGLIDRFLAITESKVSILDANGDENWDALPDEITICLKKIAKREQLSFDWKLLEPQIAHELREAIDARDQPDSYQNGDEQVSAVAREWFRLLRTVEGVGAKEALAILSRFEPYELGYIIRLRLGDKEAIMRASGISPKVAKRIVT
jgi:hypothetical protein